MPTKRLVTLSCILVLVMSAPSLARAGEPLARDPALVEGRLPCGLRYLIKARPDVKEAAIHLVVDVTPLDEADDEVEASRLIALLPLGATREFPQDARGALQERLGAGARVDSRTGFDGSWFMLEIPEPDDARLGAALAFCADVLDAPSFDEANIDRQRDALLSIRAAAATPRTRAQAALFSGLSPEIDLGRRFLGSDKADILALDQASLKGFHARWYAPARAVLVVVGAVAPEVVENQIAAAFESVLARPPATRTTLAPPPTDAAPILIEQPGLHVTDADIVRFEPPRPALTTTDHLRARISEEVVQDILELRMEAAARRRNVELELARAWTFDMGGRFTLRNAFTRGQPDEWRSLTGVLADALHSLRASPITESELRLAQDRRIAAERRRLAEGPDDDAEDEARDIARAAVAGDAPMSWSIAAQARIDAIRSLDVSAVCAAASRMFPADGESLALTSPPLDESPTAQAIADAFASADARNLHALVVEAANVFDALPAHTSDAPAETIQLRPTGAVLSAWLANSVRVHQRRMDSEPDLVRVALSLTGGRIDETPETHGFTEAATVAFTSPATAGADARTLAGAIKRTTIRIEARAHEDLVLVQASAVRDDLPTLLRLLSTILHEGRIDSAAFDAWKQERIGRARQTAATPYYAAPSALARTAYAASSVGVQTPDEATIARITRADAQAWLDRMLAEGAIEIAIVGDVQRAEALNLAVRWFSALPTRPPVTDARHAGERTLRYRPWPHRRTLSLGPQTDQGLAMVGFHTPGRAGADEALRLDLAAAVLDARLKRASNSVPGLIEPMHAVAWSSDAYDNHGFVVGVAVTTAAGVDAVGEQLDDALQWLLMTGPDSIMLADVAERLASEREQRLASPRAWADRLARLDYHNRSLADMLDEPARLRAVQPHEIQRAVRSRARAASIFKILVKGGDDVVSPDNDD